MNSIEIIDTDVLVVGGGGAGARAALEANEAGAKVTLAVKGDFGIMGSRGSGTSGGGLTNMFIYFAVPGGKVAPGKEADLIFERIIQAGHGLANRRLSRILVDEAIQARAKLEKWGVVLNMMPFAGGKVAKMLAPMPGLADVIRGAGDIRVRERMTVTDLLVRDGACIGAIGVDEGNGELCLFRAAATILATGGAGQLFMHCFHPSCDTGDGHAMAYEAGAELINMEYLQLVIGMVYPTICLLPHGNWGLYPRVRNGTGEEFIHKYLPKGVTVEDCLKPKPQHSVFSTRDASQYLEMAFVKETREGRANEHNALYLEPINPNTVPRWQFERLSNRGMDWSKEVEINVACHCFNGGLRIDENAQTSVPGLYAVGETAAGPWGADRLGGLMHAFSHVFGVRAGKHA
ncbi:MAG: FAD-binding protein, partial [Chloroflexota bacterium]